MGILWSDLKISSDEVKFAANYIKANFIVCKLSIKRVATFGMELYRNQWPVNFILQFTELQIGSNLSYIKILSFEVILANVIKSKEIENP